MKKRTILTAAVAALLLATLAVIWGFSMQSGTVSQETSLGMLDAVKPALERIVGRGNATDHLVRKLAHFAEFAVLGCELALLPVLYRRVRAQGVVNCLFFALAAAVTDETIQIFSGRGSQVADVLLDFSGAAAGIAAVLLVYALAGARRRTKAAAEPARRGKGE